MIRLLKFRRDQELEALAPAPALADIPTVAKQSQTGSQMHSTQQMLGQIDLEAEFLKQESRRKRAGGAGAAERATSSRSLVL